MYQRMYTLSLSLSKFLDFIHIRKKNLEKKNFYYKE